MARTFPQTGEGEVIEYPTSEGEPGEVAVNGQAPEPEAAKPPRTSIMFGTNVPIEMKDLLDKAAEGVGKTAAVWLRELLATTVGYTLPAQIARKGRAANVKYANMSEDEKKAAIAADQKADRQKAAALLAALEAGDLNVDLAEILAKYKPAERAPRKAKDEAVSEAAVEPASVTA